MLSVFVALTLSRPAYSHQLHVVRDEDNNPVLTTLEVKMRNGRTLWKRRFSGGVEIKWSSDHRAVAVYGDLGYLTYWTAGGSVNRIKLPRSRGPWEAPEDFSASTSWSPDNHRLLFIFPRTQGDMILGLGELIILSLKTRREQYLGYVDRAVWLNQKTVRFHGRRFSENEDGPAVTPFGPIDKLVK